MLINLWQFLHKASWPNLIRQLTHPLEDSLADSVLKLSIKSVCFRFWLFVVLTCFVRSPRINMEKYITNPWCHLKSFIVLCLKWIYQGILWWNNWWSKGSPGRKRRWMRRILSCRIFFSWGGILFVWGGQQYGKGKNNTHWITYILGELSCNVTRPYWKTVGE